MHGSVWGKAMDLMPWKRDRVQRERREKENPKKEIRIVEKGK